MKSSSQAPDGAEPRVLVVFDFDMSLVNDDSDELFCRAFCPELLSKLEIPPFTPPAQGWPRLMDDLLSDFYTHKTDVSRETILDTLGKIQVFPETVEAIKYVVEQHKATVAIMSDGNTAFIRSFLDHHGLTRYVPEVHANPGYWEEMTPGSYRLRVKPYHDDDQEPHGCSQCPRNLCKGSILDKLQGEHQFDIVLYVGDGIGDFCPSTRMKSCDVVFARASDSTGKVFGLMHHVAASPDKLRARVVPWTSGVDILTEFQQILRPITCATSIRRST